MLINEPTPFGFYQEGYTPPSRKVTTGTAPLPGLNGAYYYNAPAELSFSGDFSFSFAAPNSSKTIVKAAQSISVSNSTLSVPAGDELVMEPTRTALLQCAPQAAVAAGPSSCAPNGWALRPANVASNTLSGAEAKQLSSGMELAPNPAKGSTVVSLRGEANEYIERVEVFAISGQQVWAAPPLTRVREVSIPLNGWPPGLYVVRVVSTHRSYVQKLQVD